LKFLINEHADDDMTADAFNKLATSGVHSLPVSAGGQIIGVLDLADFSQLAIRVFTRKEGAPPLTARECMNLSGNDAFVCLTMDATILDALKALNRVHQHRICIARIKSDHSTVFALLSQIDMVNYVLEHM
jgi:hypothetical protein